MNKTIKEAIGNLAVRKAINDRREEEIARALKEQLPAGQQDLDVDVAVRVKGSLTVSDWFEQANVSAVPWRVIAMACFDKLNDTTRRKVLREIVEAWEIKEPWGWAQYVADLELNVKEETWDTFESLKERTKDKRRTITTNLSVEEI